MSEHKTSPTGNENGWQIQMGWRHTLFLHWKTDPVVLSSHLPAGLELDLHADFAWIGIVAFEMTNVRRRFVPPLPGMRSYPEINVRTYCRHQGQAGIFFFSLDTPEWFTRTIGKRFFHLPYRKRHIHFAVSPSSVTTYRTQDPDKGVEFDATYGPQKTVSPLSDTAFSHWSSERYSFFSANAHGNLYRCDVTHNPWPTQSVDYALRTNHLLDCFSKPFGEPDAAHYSRGVEVHASGIKRVC